MDLLISENIRLGNKKDISSLIKLFNIVTLHLHNKGINQWGVPWQEDKILNDLLRKSVYVIEKEGKIIATFSLSKLKHLDSVKIDLHSLYLAKIAILPEHQGKGIGTKIMQFVNKLAEEKRFSIYLDCWAGNHKLKEFYTNNGYQYLGDFPENDYYISIFKFK